MGLQGSWEKHIFEFRKVANGTGEKTLAFVNKSVSVDFSTFPFSLVSFRLTYHIFIR